MATVFWDKDGIILLDYLEGQKPIIASYYKEVLRKLKTAFAKKQQGNLHCQILFHHENAQHTWPRLKRQFYESFAGKSFHTIPAVLIYLLVISCYFQNSRNILKGTRFQSINETKREVVTWLTRQAPDFYQEEIS